jgi:hypothetical protein
VWSRATPAARRKQSLAYVFPSHPHTGESPTSGHGVTAVTHAPVISGCPHKPAGRSQSWPAGHSPPPAPPHPPAHPPSAATATPASPATQALGQVVLSHPHTGASTFGHATGRGPHTPNPPHCPAGFTHICPAPHSAVAVHAPSQVSAHPSPSPSAGVEPSGQAGPSGHPHPSTHPSSSRSAGTSGAAHATSGHTHASGHPPPSLSVASQHGPHAIGAQHDGSTPDPMHTPPTHASTVVQVCRSSQAAPSAIAVWRHTPSAPHRSAVHGSPSEHWASLLHPTQLFVTALHLPVAQSRLFRQLTHCCLSG